MQRTKPGNLKFFKTKENFVCKWLFLNKGAFFLNKDGTLRCSYLKKTGFAFCSDVLKALLIFTKLFRFGGSAGVL